MGKAAGRSAREPRRSLVTYLEMPTLWSEGEGRCPREQNEHPPSGSSGVAGAACGGRDTVQDGRPTAVLAQSQQPVAYKAIRNRRGLSAGVGGVHSTVGGRRTTQPRPREGTLLCSRF